MLIAIAKLNNIDPQAWLADVPRRIADHPARRLHELLPWNWHVPTAEHAVARNLSLVVTADCRRSCRLCAVSPRPRSDAYSSKHAFDLLGLSPTAEL